MTTRVKKWKTPKWMLAYMKFLSHDATHNEDYMNCDGKDCNLFSNGPRAIVCSAACAEVVMLMRLYEAGSLTYPVK